MDETGTKGNDPGPGEDTDKPQEDDNNKEGVYDGKVMWKPKATSCNEMEVRMVVMKTPCKPMLRNFWAPSWMPKIAFLLPSLVFSLVVAPSRKKLKIAKPKKF